MQERKDSQKEGERRGTEQEGRNDPSRSNQQHQPGQQHQSGHQQGNRTDQGSKGGSSGSGHDPSRSGQQGNRKD